MEPLPDIVMQCPKCGKEHAQDVVYCETCSAMLEPVEKTPAGSGLHELRARNGKDVLVWKQQVTLQ